MGFEAKHQLHVVQNALVKHQRARLAAFDKIGNVFSLTYSQIIAQQFRQLNVYCRNLYFIKTGHDINCCVFKYRECINEIKALQASMIPRHEKLIQYNGRE